MHIDMFIYFSICTCASFYMYICVCVHVYNSHIVLQDVYLPGIYFRASVIYVYFLSIEYVLCILKLLRQMI